jgi:rhodanese-related sulfurtransferase
MVGVSTPSIPEVSVGDVPADAVLLDVREDDEWAAGRAPGAVHVPMTELADRLDEVPEGDPLYVICRSGGRSARVTAYLNSQGWDSVNVTGGMSVWAARGRPLVADGDARPEVI